MTLSVIKVPNVVSYQIGNDSQTTPYKRWKFGDACEMEKKYGSFDLSLVNEDWKKSIITRKRRRAVNTMPEFPDLNFTAGNILEQIEKYFEEVGKYFENLQLIPIEYCNSTAQLCPAGSPGSQGLPGPKGQRGNTGPRGMQGPPGLIGDAGPQGNQGPPGPRGFKGEIGSLGPRGPLGTSKTSSFDPYAFLSPAQSLEDENSRTLVTFRCKASGNPRPSVSWRFKGQTLLQGDKYSIKDDGTLVIRRVSSEDVGWYVCVATNTLGSHEASGKISDLHFLRYPMGFIENPRPSSLKRKFLSRHVFRDATTRETGHLKCTGK